MAFIDNPYRPDQLFGPEFVVIFVLMIVFLTIIKLLRKRQKQSDELLIKLIETLNSREKVIGS